jgi:predicted nucleic acid-binding Zn finger protein
MSVAKHSIKRITGLNGRRVGKKPVLARRPLSVAVAVRNPVKSTRTFYVRSENDARKRYFVQRIRRGRRVTFFCSCPSFINRNLPHLDTNTFSGCKHVKAVRKALAK